MRSGDSASSRLRRASERGSVLIIVIWICLGLVALTVYFSDTMSSEVQAGANRTAEVAARQAVAGGTRYAGYLLGQFATNGAVPQPEDYKAAELPVGDALFWFVGRDLNQPPTNEPVFGLVDEASKLNLNTATRGMLEALPGMTPELADAIVAWRSRNQASANDNLYSRLDPPRLNKAAPFESTDELRLVYGATLEIIFGEDANRNGVLEDNENDGENSAPRDNADGLIQPGILEYVTVHSRQPNTRANGARRINITTAQTRQQLAQLLQQRFGGQRRDQIMNAVGAGELRSVAEFMVASRMTPEEFAQIRSDITASNGNTVQGLVNVNTASEAVLACIPGIGPENAAALVAYRLGHAGVPLTSMAWITQILNRAAITRAGPYITDQSYQFSADVVAVGRTGRGYCRQRTIFDMTSGTPRAIYHQDLTAYGWALGTPIRQTLRENRGNRT